MNHLELADLWNAAHTAWAKDQPLPAELESWRECYGGTGINAVDDLAMPEPWIGDLSSTPEAVTMGIHLGGADPAFHHRGGAWPKAIAKQHGGSYSEWAATGAYFGSVWEAAHSANAHAAQRHRFLSAWTGHDLAPSQVVDFPLFPWPVADWKSAAFDVKPDVLREFVLEPIASTGARWAFGFGKDWWDIIEALDLPILDQLGDGGRPYPTQVDHRRWLVAEGPNGLRVAAMRLDSMPIPPAAEETEELRRVLESGPAGDNRRRSVPRDLEVDLSARLRDLGMSYMNIARLMQAVDDAELKVDAWYDDDAGDGGVALSVDGEPVVMIQREWADFTTASPAGTSAVAGADSTHRLELATVAVAATRSARTEPKPLGMCTQCFNVLNPDGTCAMECEE